MYFICCFNRLFSEYGCQYSVCDAEYFYLNVKCVFLFFDIKICYFIEICLFFENVLTFVTVF